MAKSKPIFSVGSVVILKGGGPKMIVAETFENSTLRTQWFADGRLFSGDFEVQSLQLWRDK